jgi:hypothetical protein
VGYIGWLSTILLAACGVPLVVEALRSGKSNVNPWFLWLWCLGELLGLVYCISLSSPPLIVNYSFNLSLILIVLRYRYFPRSNDESTL